MFNFLPLTFYIIRNFFIINFTGCNFLLRKIPYIGFIFSPFAILGVHNLKKSEGERICKAVHSLGATYIKLGQLLSTRADLVGQKLAADLEKLQDELPAFPTKIAKKMIEQEFDKEITELFSEFSDNAVAAASIAQVHKAKLQDGKEVAVKILRPKIKKHFKHNIKLFYKIAEILNHFTALKRLKLIEVIRTFEKVSKKEMDFRFEAAAAAKFKDNLQLDDDIYIPQIYWRRTSEKILCIEWVDGIKINHYSKLKEAGFSLEEIAMKFLHCYFNQAYRDGFFHADMHPGNIIIMQDGKIAFIDFGIMGKLSEADRQYVAQIMNGFVTRDYDMIAKMHLDAGYIPKDTDVADFALACHAIGEPIFGLATKEISIAKMLAHLFAVTDHYGMETQPQLLLLQKTLLLVEGVACHLNPELNMWELGEDWMKQNLKINKNLRQKFENSVNEITKIQKILPEIVKNTHEISEAVLEYNMTRKNKTNKTILVILGAMVGFIAAKIL